jgi:hypothetical protein
MEPADIFTFSRRDWLDRQIQTCAYGNSHRKRTNLRLIKSLVVQSECTTKIRRVVHGRRSQRPSVPQATKKRQASNHMFSGATVEI